MTDDELLARLRAADPATSLPPADPEGTARLVEDVMSTELTTENRETGTRQRSPLTWAVAAAAVLVIAGAGFLGLRAVTDDGSAPTDAGQAAPSATHLTVSDDVGAGKCMVPTADVLGRADVAFDGTVTAVDGDLVTLTPTHWYAGDPTDEVTVTAPSVQMQRVASAVSFEQGGRYLVSAVDDQVSLCGFSAAYDDDLAAVYQQAFG
ncbi:hypothetical protein [Nocardioides sp. YIM 152315]|uniref:hypothetical protein n=1 Tax=Nocardioides sp. YIM 152315 TaxID=3031760 RepID=UPI0023DAA919|nr:hypothetical protein [Nocardioides sp. YIM 152315]MDF1604872.1 hypothetical protein [Nocardioides sp. YIM 152315]